MEPDLGMGTIISVENWKIQILFRTSDVTRQYSTDNSPLKRICLRVGEQVKSYHNESFAIESIDERDGLFHYIGTEFEIVETDIDDTISFLSPMDRLLSAHVDRQDAYQLRTEMLTHNHNYYNSKLRGFIGPRVDVIWHQLYILQTSIARQYQRLLLADEVGLGKTIEACLIMHNLLISGRIDRVLIIVPNALVYQWFVELLRKFNLTFAIFDRAYYKSENMDDELSPFHTSQLGLTTMDYIFSEDGIQEEIMEAGWDLVIVDEIHRVSRDTEQFDWLQSLATVTQRMLLLTATPEVIGYESLFAICSLLYPDLYNDYDKFLEDTKAYSTLADIVDKIENAQVLTNVDMTWLNDKYQLDQDLQKILTSIDVKADVSSRNRLVDTLLDCYGLGRIIFRNTRKNIDIFTKRQVHLAPLIAKEIKTTISADDPRILWLVKLLQSSKDKKILMICHTQENVLAVNKLITTHIKANIALFHEGMTLLQRDKMAAYFAQPDGAQMLICSEIGSEGRNFQFCQNLVFFDCPLDLELIEQRIGRLDRIGQKKDIHIYLPFIKHSRQEAIIKILHEGAKAFGSAVAYGNRLVEDLGEQIFDVAREYSETKNDTKIKALITKIQAYAITKTQELENGRDRLLERNSYKPSLVKGLTEGIKKLDKDTSLDDFMLKVFEYFGISVEEIDDRTWFLKATGGYEDILPGFKGSKMIVTFSREQALVLENILFLTWDHPMVRGAIDIFLGSEQGNSSFAIWEDDVAQRVYIEASYVVECVAPKDLYIERFLPATPVRILINNQLEDCSDDISTNELEGNLGAGTNKMLKDVLSVSVEIVEDMTEKATELATPILEDIIDDSIISMDKEYKVLLDRNLYLKKINKHITAEEIEAIVDEQDSIHQHLCSARLRLDAVRLVVRGRITR